MPDLAWPLPAVDGLSLSRCHLAACSETSLLLLPARLARRGTLCEGMAECSSVLRTDLSSSSSSLSGAMLLALLQGDCSLYYGVAEMMGL